MTDWYIDIFPCDACENSPLVGSRCRKGRSTIHVEGCHDCGILVNMEWYYDNVECPDFIYYEPHDPSGS